MLAIARRAEIRPAWCETVRCAIRGRCSGQARRGAALGAARTLLISSVSFFMVRSSESSPWRRRGARPACARRGGGAGRRTMAAVGWRRTRRRKQASGPQRAAAQALLADSGEQGEVWDAFSSAASQAGLAAVVARARPASCALAQLSAGPAYTSEVGMGDTAARGAGADEESSALKTACI